MQRSYQFTGRKCKNRGCQTILTQGHFTAAFRGFVNHRPLMDSYCIAMSTMISVAKEKIVLLVVQKVEVRFPRAVCRRSEQEKVECRGRLGFVDRKMDKRQEREN